ncbi:hypothetical protein EJB05_22384 [Eragrostis curvula]|uniref:VWFA domain-containing protein n=1 Tax=Eragrostis curvula TaxID=38414 RepID=A0A5J9V5R2_9POAL|nr:hypothetical protein EJB05_22384 [Eragrostis curvula]
MYKEKISTMGVSGALACLVFTLLLSEARTSDAESVKLTTTPIFPQIPRSQTSKDFQVLVSVEAPAAAGQKGRVPIDLAVVVNVGGGRSRLDSVNKALRFIIWQLHDDDRLAVIGTSNTRLFGETATGFLDIRDARRNAESSLDKLEPRPRDGQAQQASGLKEAIKMLSELPASPSRRASFIILVTDTMESGKLAREFRKNKQAVVHTFGLGAGHDPKALLSIAEESRGTYSFVDDQNADAIAGAVAVCVSGLKAVAAVGTRLRLEAAAGSGIRIERVESGGYSTAIAGDKTSGEVTVGALYAGEQKSFIVHLHVPAVPATSNSVDGACDKQHLLTASFVTGDGGDASPTQTILSVQRPLPDCIAVAATLQKVPVPVVMDHIAQFGVLDMVTTFVENEIWELSSNSITPEVGAAMATKLQSRWEEFLQARQFWSGLDLGVFEVEINKMVSLLAAPGSSPVLVTAYMLSWLSSYQMQRPTAMGSPSSVAPTFVTLSMQLTLQQLTTIVTAPGGGGGGGGGCVCEEACVEAQPPPVFVPSGRHGDTYNVNAAYPAELLDAINQAINQMYLRMRYMISMVKLIILLLAYDAWV